MFTERPRQNKAAHVSCRLLCASVSERNICTHAIAKSPEVKPGASKALEQPVGDDLAKEGLRLASGNSGVAAGVRWCEGQGDGSKAGADRAVGAHVRRSGRRRGGVASGEGESTRIAAMSGRRFWTGRCPADVWLPWGPDARVRRRPRLAQQGAYGTGIMSLVLAACCARAMHCRRRSTFIVLCMAPRRRHKFSSGTTPEAPVSALRAQCCPQQPQQAAMSSPARRPENLLVGRGTSRVEDGTFWCCVIRGPSVPRLQFRCDEVS